MTTTSPTLPQTVAADIATAKSSTVAHTTTRAALHPLHMTITVLLVFLTVAVAMLGHLTMTWRATAIQSEENFHQLSVEYRQVIAELGQ